MITKIKNFVKAHLDDIILLIGVVLISLFSFAIGYIVAKQQEKESIKIEQHDANLRMICQCCQYANKVIDNL